MAIYMHSPWLPVPAPDCLSRCASLCVAAGPERAGAAQGH